MNIFKIFFVSLCLLSIARGYSMSPYKDLYAKVPPEAIILQRLTQKGLKDFAKDTRIHQKLGGNIFNNTVERELPFWRIAVVTQDCVNGYNKKNNTMICAYDVILKMLKDPTGPSVNKENNPPRNN